MPDYQDPKLTAEAKRLLQRLLPKARRLLGQESEFKPLSPASAQLWPHLKLKNLLGIYVYQERGGWQADLVLKKVPLGVPAALGTPSIHPLPSRAAAEQAAVDILANVLIAERQQTEARRKRAGAQPEPEEAWFQLYGCWIGVPRHILTTVKPLSEQSQNGPAALIEKVEALLGAHSVADLDREGLEALPQDAQVKLLVLLALLLCHGVFRHPDPRRLPLAAHSSSIH